MYPRQPVAQACRRLGSCERTTIHEASLPNLAGLIGKESMESMALGIAQGETVLSQNITCGM